MEVPLQKIAVRLCSYQSSRPVSETLAPAGNTKLVHKDACGEEGLWEIGFNQMDRTRWKKEGETGIPDDASADTSDSITGYKLRFRLISGAGSNTSVGVRIKIENWSAGNYVVLPAAVYAGNRFEARRLPYLPKLVRPEDIGPDKPEIISDVPRFSLHPDREVSVIQQLSGDMAVPSVGIFFPEKKEGFWLLFPEECGVRLEEKNMMCGSRNDTEERRISEGRAAEEEGNREAAGKPDLFITLTVPGVREGTRYRICDNEVPSADRGKDFAPGGEVSLNFQIHQFFASGTEELFSHLIKIQNHVVKKGTLADTIPLSAAFSIQEEKYNRDNWEDEHGYYSIGIRDMFLQDWQIGWVGGMINTYPLLMLGNEETRKRVFRNFEFVFPNGIAPSGLFWDCGSKGEWYGGDYRQEHAKNWHLIRKSGDGAYFILKTLLYLKKTGQAGAIRDKWLEGTFLVVDTLCKLWIKNRQFGQFVDNVTGEIVVGGSSSGASVTAALTLAAGCAEELFGGICRETRAYAGRWQKAAEESGEFFYNRFIARGYTCGGPGDAMQNPDSESGYALVNAYVELYERTGEELWLNRAKAAANLYSSWVMSYDFKFPEESEFGRLGIKTYGAVFANTQNKHAAPGICTDSGYSLFRLYRASEEPYYLHLAEATAHNITQYLSRQDRPVKAKGKEMPSGWMNERVNTSDWLEPVGEIFCGCTWAEVSCMLVRAELPGVYLDTDSGETAVFDSAEASAVRNGDNILLTITNPTGFDADFTWFAENAEDRRKALGHNITPFLQRVRVRAGEKSTITIPGSV